MNARRIIVNSLLSAVLVCAFSHPVFADLIGVNADDGKLYSVSETNAAVTFIANTGIGNPAAGNFWADIAFAPNGTLYGFTVGPDTLYTINPSTGATTSIGPMGLNFVFEGGLAFAPDGTAYGTNGADNTTNTYLFTINLSTGAATTIGALSGGTYDINGLAYRSDGMLIGLDRVTNSLLLINPTTAAVTTLAAVPTTVGTVGGLTIDNGVGYYVTGGLGGSSGSNDLYSFDLSTGSSNLIGSLGPTFTGLGLSGIAAAPAPEPSEIWMLGMGLIALLGAAKLQIFTRFNISPGLFN